LFENRVLMSLDAETQDRLIGLANGSIPPQSGMEIHFVHVCKGESMPCSQTEIEWFDFVEGCGSRLTQKPGFTYEYGLPGMADLDDIVYAGVDLGPYQDLRDALVDLSQASSVVNVLEETRVALEHELVTKATAATVEWADRVFRARTQKEIDARKEVVRRLTSETTTARTTLAEHRARQSDVSDKLDVLISLDRELLAELKICGDGTDQKRISFSRECVRRNYEALVTQDRELIESIQEFETQIRHQVSRAEEIEQEILDLGSRSPQESDRAKSYEDYIAQNDAVVKQVRQDLATAQERLRVSRDAASTVFATWKFDLTIERTKLTMSPGRRQTYTGKRSMPCWGEYRSDCADFEFLLAENGIEKLYHFTDSRNLGSIAELGGLYSWKELNRKNRRIPAAGGDSLSRTLDVTNGLQDFVHLSFARAQPMLASALRDGRIEQAVHLEISPDVILFSMTQFANRNAATSKSRLNVGSHLKDLRIIKFQVFSTESWDSHTFDDFQAEVLVPSNVPKEFILNWSDVINGS
jgi:hypothetical protein